MASELFDDSDFIGLSEEEQIDKLRAQQPSFDKYYQADEEGAVKMLRERLGSGVENQSVVGRVIRQFGSGVGEAFTDVAKLPFDAAEWVASKAGSDWSTSVDDSIEEYQREKFPDPTTPEGKVARSIGYWGAVGLQTYATGGVLGYLSRFPVKGAKGLGKAGRFISGGAKVELGAGVAGGAAEGSVDAYMDDDNPAKPWLMIGAGILAGGGAGVAIAARGAAKRSRTRAAEIGEQPTSPGGDGPTPLPVSSAESKKMNKVVGRIEREIIPSSERPVGFSVQTSDGYRFHKTGKDEWRDSLDKDAFDMEFDDAGIDKLFSNERAYFKSDEWQAFKKEFPWLDQPSALSGYEAALRLQRALRDGDLAAAREAKEALRVIDAQAPRPGMPKGPTILDSADEYALGKAGEKGDPFTTRVFRGSGDEAEDLAENLYKGDARLGDRGTYYTTSRRVADVFAEHRPGKGSVEEVSVTVNKPFTEDKIAYTLGSGDPGNKDWLTDAPLDSPEYQKFFKLLEREGLAPVGAGKSEYMRADATGPTSAFTQFAKRLGAKRGRKGGFWNGSEDMRELVEEAGFDSIVGRVVDDPHMGSFDELMVFKKGLQDGPPSANSVRLDAADQATADELKEILGQDALGRNMSYLDLDVAQKTSAQAAMRGWVNDVMVVLKPQRIDQIADGIAEVMNRTGRTYDPSSGTMTQHLMETIASGDITVHEANKILRGFDTSIEQIADIQYPFQDSASTAASIMGHLSGAARRVKRDLLEKMSPEQVALLKELDPGIQGMSIWKRLENVRRGLLVTQIATAMRNMGTQVANIGIHALEDTMEKAVMTVVGKTGKRGQAIENMNPVNATGTILRIGGMLLPGKSKTFQQVKELGEFFNKSDLKKNRRLLDPLTASWSSDIMIAPTKDKLGFLEKLTLWANSANRLQEFGIRRAVFTAELDRVLSQRGQSLGRLIDEGKLGSLNNDDVKAAVAKALETTWGEEFLSNMDGVRGMAGSMIEAINKIGIGPLRMTQVIPFPRFMANSIKWQYQHSPLPMVKLLFSPDEWKRVAAGDIKPIIKSTTGTGMFMSALQLRNSEYAGERWYEIRPSDDINRFLQEPPGTTYDVRAYNPFASFLFAAELVRRAADGSVPAMSTRDIAMGFMSTNLRAGAGMYVLDQFLDSMGEAAAGISNPEGSFLQAIASEGVQVGGEYLGAAWSGMLVPFQQLKDVARSFQEGGFLSDVTGMTMAGDDSMVRDTSEAPFAGQMARKLPGADQNLPGVELPTREAPPRTAGPLKRQFLGITARGPKNPVEKELDRLGFGRGNILPSQGDDKWNTLRAKHMGPLVEKYLPDLVNSDHYQQSNDEQKFIYLEEGIARARRFATQMAAAENPELAQKVRLGSRKKSLRRRDAKRQRDLVARRAEMEVLRTARTN